MRLSLCFYYFNLEMCRKEDEVRTKLFLTFVGIPPKFKGHGGQVAVRAGAYGSWGTSVGRGRGSTHRRRSHNHASCVWFGTGSQDLSLCASQTFSPRAIQSFLYPSIHSAACRPPLPPDRTQMVWIKRRHDWAVSSEEIPKSNSLLSLNTPD